MPRPGVFVRYRKDMEYAIGFQNVCIFNFGNHIDINIKCTVEKYSVTSQSIRIYNGRNLLCACKIGDECNATLSTSKGEGTIIWIPKGDELPIMVSKTGGSGPVRAWGHVKSLL